MSPELDTSNVPALETSIGDGYVLKRFVGAGGLGAVYEAVSPEGERVAVKLLQRKTLASSDADAQVKRLVREAHLSVTIDSPHVAATVDAGWDKGVGSPFIVMPLLIGLDLWELIQKIGPVHPTVVARIFRQACRGLSAAHACGAVHRDLKPANLYLDHAADGQVTLRILDFGLARWLEDESDLTMSGAVMGTPMYMPPEQIASTKRVDLRADLWGIGATMYEVLSGHAPFEHVESTAELYAAVSTTDVPPLQDAAPWIEPGLAAVVHGTLLRSPEARCPNAASLAKALKPFTEGSDDVDASMLESLAAEYRETAASRATLPESWEDVEPERKSSHKLSLTISEADPLIGQVLAGRYELLRRLGRGGMGAVYDARDDEGNRWAVKVVGSAKAGRDSSSRRRFAREAKAAKTIESDHVVRVVEVGEEGPESLPYIVMELLRGMDLGALLGRHGALAPETVARVFTQACMGLGTAHELGYVHRDIKPANLFLHETPTGEVVTKLCDFGIVKQVTVNEREAATTDLTQTGGVIGSPMYMSPEQAQAARDVDAQSDVWSLGATMFHALSGQPLWKGRESLGELIVAICTHQVPHLQDLAPWVPPGLAAAVHRALRRTRSERFDSMKDFAAAIEPFAGKRLRLRRKDLAPVPDGRRAKAAPRGEGPETITSAEPGAARAKAHAKAQSARSRTMVFGAVAVAAVAGVALLMGDRDDSPAPSVVPSPDTASASSEGAQVTTATASDSEERGDQKFWAKIEIVPADAEVTVNGDDTMLEEGVLDLVGVAGQSFQVVVTAGDHSAKKTVYIDREGEPSLTRIELDVPGASVAGRPGKPGPRPKAPTGEPATKPTAAAKAAPTATAKTPPASTGDVKMVDTWRD